AFRRFMVRGNGRSGCTIPRGWASLLRDIFRNSDLRHQHAFPASAPSHQPRFEYLDLPSEPREVWRRRLGLPDCHRSGVSGQYLCDPATATTASVASFTAANAIAAYVY